MERDYHPFLLLLVCACVMATSASGQQSNGCPISNFSAEVRSLKSRISDLINQLETNADSTDNCARNLLNRVAFLESLVRRPLCPDLFPLERGDSCYSISVEDVDFNTAKAACQAKGGKLAEIETPGENEFLRLYARLDGTTAYWIGGSDQAREGNFVWVSDNRPITYATWTNGQPDDYGGNEDCLEIRVVFGSLWNDHVCTVSNRYICETSRPQ